MFDCKQDIGLLHGSLLSAAKLYSENLFDCVDVKDAADIVYKSIRFIIHKSLKSAKDEKEKVNIELHCNERLHAVLFFTILRSYGIKSQAADEYYDSVLYNWPLISWKFYVELSIKCNWSIYFVMCALQLPSEILLDSLKRIFEIQFESDIECYSWHLILQTMIYKLCQVSTDKEVHYPFNFDFVIESPTTFKDKSLEELTNKYSETTSIQDKINGDSHKVIEKENEIDNKCVAGVHKNNSTHDINNTIVLKETCNPVQIFDDDEDIEEEEYMTPYSYAISDDEDVSTETCDGDLTIFKELSNCIHDRIALMLEESNNISALKVLLHAAKTFSKIFKNGLMKDDACLLPFNNYMKLLKDNLLSDVIKEKMDCELKECLVTFTKHAYASVSWNICMKYLLFLLKHYTEKMYPCDCASLNSDSFYKNLISSVNCLNNLKNLSFKSKEDIELLCKIIKFDFEGSFYALKTVLSDAEILKENYVLMTLEENCHVINLSQIYSLIIDQIMRTDSTELKIHLLKILYSCLQINKLEVYNTVIGYIMTNYGLTEKFQLPDYYDILSDFTYRSPNQKEIEKKIPALLIQNPKDTLIYLIDQALLQGSDGEIFIQFLKHFRNACFYMKNSSQVCILHEILNDYFEKPKLEPLILKNMVQLYRYLAQVHSETPILFPWDFFNECIIGKLHSNYDNIGLLLECTHVLIPALLSDSSIMKKPAVIYNLIAQCGALTDYFIITGNGENKSLILPIIKELEIHHQKNKLIDQEQKFKLWSIFKGFDEMTCVYFEEFLPQEKLQFDKTATIWTQCCKNEDISHFEEKVPMTKLTYASLVNTLTEVLPHLTQKEWSFCFNIIKVCCANNKLQEEITSSNNLFQLSGSDLETYAALLPVITSVNFILNDNIDGSLYVCCCFSNFLKDALFKVKSSHPYLLLSVALEICCIMLHISPEMLSIYHALLLEIKKKLSSLSSNKSDYTKLLNHAISCLPVLCNQEN